MKKIILTLIVVGSLMATSCGDEKKAVKETAIKTNEKANKEEANAATEAANAETLKVLEAEDKAAREDIKNQNK